ncbi:MAG TPA: amidohydrolase family protein, partial [Blastocatellia bacterium]|nr:amidohydrolase family protein [Blastocatellia bacterium]
MRRITVLIVLALFSAAVLFSFDSTEFASQVLQPAPADLILRNGLVYTVDSTRTLTEAVAIRSGKIAFVGASRDAMRLKGKNTQVIDLKGQFVLPGFNDNHVHFASAAAFLEFNIMRVATQQEFVARVKDVASRLSKGEWILGGYWGAYDQWTAGSAGGGRREPFSPDIQAVEAITRDHPLFIRKFDDSEFAANSAALRAAGLDPGNPKVPPTRSTEPPRAPQNGQSRVNTSRGTEPAGSKVEGVEFLHDSAGRFNGHLRGRAVMELFGSVIAKTFSHERRIQQTKNALSEIRRYGVTNISDMSDDEQLEIYRELHKAGELTVRIHFRPGLDRWRDVAEQGIKIGAGDEWIRLGALKGHIDGIMGTKTARFFEPYANDPTNRGRWRPLMTDEKGNFVDGKFLQYMLDADSWNLQITVHAIGDEANHVLLDYLEELNKRNGVKDRRFRLVHAQVLAPDDFKRLGKLGVVAEVQPYHLSDDMRWMEERIGRERCKGAYAFRSIMESGAVLCFGTDWPGTSASEYPINPLLGLYAAVTRQTLKGEPAAGWFPDQRISIEDAIRAYTLNTAYANFEENVKGSIEAGKVADLVVLDKNLLSATPREMLDARVIYTIVAGKIV